VGLAVQVGPRPLNPAWIDPHEQERELRASIARRKAEREARRSAALRDIEDPAERAELERAFARERARERAADEREQARPASVVGTSGAAINFSPRFGIETEPIPGRVHTRFGSYYEPNRLFGRVGRQHFTFGADVRVLSTTFWGLAPELAYTLQASLDLAPRYDSFSAGIGVWH
jgi:hypothetical protein